MSIEAPVSVQGQTRKEQLVRAMSAFPLEADSPPCSLPMNRPRSHRSAYYHFADLDDQSLVSVVRDVPHDFLRVRSETGLKRLD